MDIRRRNIMALMCAGASGGALKPADQDAIAQWLYDLDSDGITFLDYKDTVDAPVATGVNASEFDGLAGNRVIVIPSSDDNTLGSSDFEISADINPLNQSGVRAICGKWDSAGDKEYLLFLNSGKLQLNTVTDGGNYNFSSSNLVPVGPSRITCRKVHDTVTFSIRGVDETATGAGSSSIVDTGIDFTIGRANDVQYPFYGYIANVKVERLATSDIDLIVKTGQSNEVGWYLGLADVPVEMRADQPHLFSYDINNGTYTGTNEALTSVDQVNWNFWGSEISLGYRMTENGLRDSAFVKVATGGIGISNWLSGGNMHTRLVGTINTAITDLKRKGYNPIPRLLIFNQGETDAETTANASLWKERFLQAMSDLYDSTGLVYDKSIVMRIYDYPESQYEGVSVVRSAQDSLASGGYTVMSNDDLVLKSDAIHYTGASQIEMGENQYAEYAKLDLLYTGYVAQEHPLSEGTGTHYDVAAGRNDSTSNNDLANTIHGVYSANLNRGFYVATQQTPPYIPALLDGSSAADGSPITNPGTETESLVHNGFEGGILQTDADFAVFEALASLWGDGVTEWVAAYYAALLAHTNFSLGLVIRWKCVNGAYIVKEYIQRGVDYAWTPADYLKDKRWSEQDCEPPAGALEPVTHEGEIVTNNGEVVFDA